MKYLIISSPVVLLAASSAVLTPIASSEQLANDAMNNQPVNYFVEGLTIASMLVSATFLAFIFIGIFRRKKD